MEVKGKIGTLKNNPWTRGKNFKEFRVSEQANLGHMLGEKEYKTKKS